MDGMQEFGVLYSLLDLLFDLGAQPAVKVDVKFRYGRKIRQRNAVEFPNRDSDFARRSLSKMFPNSRPEGQPGTSACPFLQSNVLPAQRSDMGKQIIADNFTLGAQFGKQRARDR
jgi:hypothetical protein